MGVISTYRDQPANPHYSISHPREASRREATPSYPPKEINTTFSNNPAKVYSQWQGSKTTANPPRAETEQYWKSIWEKETPHNTNAQWLADLKAEHRNLPEQKPVVITTADIQKRVRELEELDSSRSRRDSHLLAEEANCTP